MGKLADLATRCLDLEGPRYAMEMDIYMAIKKRRPSHVTNYTISIDSALTLIPNGWRWSLEYVDGYSASVNSGVSFPTLAIAGHPTSPELALCAAALRARDLVEGEGA